MVEYWQYIKGVETKELGDDDITEKLEMVGWGVEEAQERNKEEASTSSPGLDGDMARVFGPSTNNISRPSDPTRSRVRDSQELHLHPGTPDGSRHAQGRQGAARLGLEHWQADPSFSVKKCRNLEWISDGKA